MAADLSTVFTGIRFRNPFLLASAPPTESDSNIMRAFEAGWGGVVTKTIGLHPVVNVKGPKTKYLRAQNGGYRLSMNKKPDTTLVASWNWELISDKTIDWWLPRIESIEKAFPDKILIASIMAGSGNDKELHNWQLLTKGVQDAGADGLGQGAAQLAAADQGRAGRGRGRPRAEFLLPAHGPRGHGLERRQGQSALLGRDRGREGSGEGAGVGEADSGHGEHRRGGGRVVRRRRGRDLVVEHVAVAAAHRSGDARVRDECRRLLLLRRPRRPGDHADVARGDVADDEGVPGQVVLRHRRHRHVRSRPVVFPVGLRHRAGLHRGDARLRDRPERDQNAESRNDRVPREKRASRLEDAG